MNKGKIFISYSHKDEKWKDRLVKHLKVLEKEGVCRIWDDSRISPGKDWKKEIESKLKEVDTAILMISQDLLASDFIMNDEIPFILGRRQMGQLEVIPVIVKPCQWQRVKGLESIQVFPPGGVPLSEGNVK